jgi:hypothetical protein
LQRMDRVGARLLGEFDGHVRICLLESTLRFPQMVQAGS